MIEIEDIEAYIEGNSNLRAALDLPLPVAVEVRELARGEYNQNYVITHSATGKEFLFRINLGSQMHLEHQIEYEARALALLSESGRTPKVLFVDGSKAFFDKGVLVEEYLSGRSLCYETDLGIAAAILADIHSVPVPPDHGLVAPENPLSGIVEECEAMFSRYRQWKKADPRVLAQVDGWFELAWGKVRVQRPTTRRHIVSTELNSANFLINERAQSYLVDWEKPLVSEVEQDLAHFLVPTTTFWKTDTILDKASVEAFLGYYDAAVAGRFDTTGLHDRLNDYLAVTCLRGITWCAMALAQHEEGERTVADSYTLEKIKAYLGNDFLSLLSQNYYSVTKTRS